MKIIKEVDQKIKHQHISNKRNKIKNMKTAATYDTSELAI